MINIFDLNDDFYSSKDAIKNFDVVSSLGHNVGKGAVICMTPMPIPLDKDNLLVPLGAI